MILRTLSMTFGRPPAIPESYVRIPLPKHVDKAIAEQSTEGLSLSIDFFVKTM